jgi:hypothetical protein
MTEGNVEIWRFGFDILQFVLTGVVGFYVYLSNRQRISSARLRKMEDHIDTRLDDHDQRLTRVEAACGHAPTHEHLGQMYERMNGISGQVEKLTGKVEGLQEGVQMIHEHLLKNGGK